MSLFFGGGAGGAGSRTGTGSSIKQATAFGGVPQADRGRDRGNGLVNWSHTVIIAATGAPQVCPEYVVPPGCAVRVRAYNGTTGNSAAVSVADYPEKLTTGNGTPLAPLDDVAWPVSNTGKIWVKGSLGDGLVVYVVTPFTGA